MSFNKSLIEQEAANLGYDLHWEDEIKPDDFYFAHRNGNPTLLRCKSINNNCVIPRDQKYPYYIFECVKAVKI